MSEAELLYIIMRTIETMDTQEAEFQRLLHRAIQRGFTTTVPTAPGFYRPVLVAELVIFWTRQEAED